MRALFRWAQSNQGCLMVTLSIGLYYVVVYRPLDNRTKAIDIPLQQAWKKLEKANQESLTQERLDLDHISRGLMQLETSLTEITNANQKLLSRISIDPIFQDRTSNPFQLIDFQNERQSAIEKLQAAAKQKSITIQPAAFDGFPQHLSEHSDPQYLWTELALTDHLIQSMIYAEIESIDSIATRRQRIPTHPQSGQSPLLTPFFAEVDLTCKSSHLSRLLLMLPSRSEEIKRDLDIDYPPNKPSLYVDQILIRKNSPQKPTMVSVWMKVVGFILVSQELSQNQEG
ncbi:hypothetical protein N8766_04455 [bacterium]|nr:hypothetical protein [bacterium]MDB4798386.1 hypothetical protein [Verrucomicrobiota bacterium]